MTRPASDVCCELGFRPSPQPPLPELTEPVETPPVMHRNDEPLVPVEHARIIVHANYRAAGWQHAPPATLLRASVADRLAAAAESLPERLGLAVFDAWRPLPLQMELHRAAYCDPTVPPGFIAEPSNDPATPPPHLTGGAVDCTLTIDGITLALGSGFDDFTDRAHAAALESEPGVERDLRRLLYWTMRAVGFVVLDCEWWHFELGTRRWAAITGHDPLYGPACP